MAGSPARAVVGYPLRGEGGSIRSGDVLDGIQLGVLQIQSTPGYRMIHEPIFYKRRIVFVVTQGFAFVSFQLVHPFRCTLVSMHCVVAVALDFQDNLRGLEVLFEYFNLLFLWLVHNAFALNFQNNIVYFNVGLTRNGFDRKDFPTLRAVVEERPRRAWGPPSCWHRRAG